MSETQGAFGKAARTKGPSFFPRSVLGITAMVLAFSIGAALSGVVLFTYYDFREKTNADVIKKYVDGFDGRFNTATKTIDAKVTNGQAAIDKSLEPLRKSKADGQTLTELSKKYSGSVWLVNTLDDQGQPSVGTAFAVSSDNSRTLLVTSYTAVKASTKSPGPKLTVRQGDKQVNASLQTWDESKDLALIVLNEGSHDFLNFAPTSPPLQPGTQVFAVSGLGGSNGATTINGFVIDVTGDAIQHALPLGPQFRGSPIIDAEGKVYAVASMNYSPAGFTPSGVWFAAPIRKTCDKVLSCPNSKDLVPGSN